MTSTPAIGFSPPPALLPVDAIGAHERRVFRTWPARTVEQLDGWVLRCNDGVTHRANSVFTTGISEAPDVERRIDAAEAFFRAQGQAPCFMISPASMPGDLDARLVARRYAVEEPSLVRIGKAGSVFSLPTADAEVSISQRPDAQWKRVFLAEYAGTGDGETRLGVIARIEPTTGFALARVGGEGAAIGMGVVEDGWMTVLGMYTLPGWRGRGHGGAVLRALAAWAQGMGAPNLFLQVTASNAAALRLYDKAGFRAAYGYHYRLAPEDRWK